MNTDTTVFVGQISYPGFGVHGLGCRFMRGGNSNNRVDLDRAAVRFVRAELERFARKLVYQLTRFPASGIFKGSLHARSLWDEYCYEIQHGPSDPQLECAWDHTLYGFLKDCFSKERCELIELMEVVILYDEGRTLIEALELQLRGIAASRAIEHMIEQP